MVYRQKPSPTVTRLVGSGINPDVESHYWVGVPPSEAARTTSGWGSHVQVPVLTEKNDPRGAFTPVAGGIQFNYPGTYEVEAVCTITGGVADVRNGLAFYTAGSISPSSGAGSTEIGGSLTAIAAATGSWFIAKSTFVVHAAGAKVLMQDYVQTTTSHTCNVQRIHAVKLAQGAPGPQGIQGIQGPVGPKGTRWGTISVWPFADSTDIPAVMQDGGIPVVGDWVVSLNGFSVGQVFPVTAVYPSGNVDVGPMIYNTQGVQGSRWGTVNVSFPGAADAELSGVPCTFADGGLPRAGDIVQNLHPDHLGDVYFIKEVVYFANSATIKKYNPVMNIRGATGPAGSALSHWPVDSVYISYSSANPAALFGGTWVAIGTGRMLIGVDPADATMDVAGDTGGAKTHTIAAANLPPHAHTINHDHGNGTVNVQYGTTTQTGGTATRVTDVANTTGGTGTSVTAQISLPAYNGNSGNGPGTSTAINHLPPFLAVYMWRRTA